MAHRGKHSNDDKNFASAKQQNQLKEAVADLSFLMERGYSDRSALPLVGDRYRLTKRQRNALLRMNCAPSLAQQRQNKHLSPDQLHDKKIFIDGYNVLIITEVALSGGYIFECMDKTYRDIASIHGTYRKVEETIPALTIIGQAIQDLGIQHAQWYFDKPVSNSGRLKTLMYELATEKGFQWDIELTNSPDKDLAALDEVLVTADGWIIDESKQWFDLARYVIDNYIKDFTLVSCF